MRKFVLPFLLPIFFFACKDDKKAAEAPADAMVKTASTSSDSKSQAAEFADPKYMDWGKGMMKEMADGNYDAYGSHFADNAVYQWSSGDSLAGRDAIVKYWKNRRATVLKSVVYANDIWLPIRVSQPQRGPDMKGVWLMCWQQVTPTYNNGKTLTFWTHQDMHFNDSDKIDRLVVYMDRAPINAALGMK